MMRRHILLWGMSGDPQVDAIRGELLRRDEPHVFLDQRAYASSRVDIEIDATTNGPKGVIDVAGRRLDVPDIGAIFVRPLNGREVAQLAGEDVDAREWEAAVVALAAAGAERALRDVLGAAARADARRRLLRRAGKDLSDVFDGLGARIHRP